MCLCLDRVRWEEKKGKRKKRDRNVLITLRFSSSLLLSFLLPNLPPFHQINPNFFFNIIESIPIARYPYGLISVPI